MRIRVPVPVPEYELSSGWRTVWIADPEGNTVEISQGFIDEDRPPPMRGLASVVVRPRAASPEKPIKPDANSHRDSIMQSMTDFVIITPLEEEREAMLAHLGRPNRLPPANDDIPKLTLHCMAKLIKTQLLLPRLGDRDVNWR